MVLFVCGEEKLGDFIRIIIGILVWYLFYIYIYKVFKKLVWKDIIFYYRYYFLRLIRGGKGNGIIYSRMYEYLVL